MEKTYTEGLVSVITPIYNAEKYLADTLNSVFAQDYRDIEIVLVDDCSNDNSAKIISEFQKSHPEIVYLRHWNLRAVSMLHFSIVMIFGCRTKSADR